MSKAADSTQTSLVRVQEKKKKRHSSNERQCEPERDRKTDAGDTQVCLCEDKPGLVVNLENLLDGVDVRSRP